MATWEHTHQVEIGDTLPLRRRASSPIYQTNLGRRLLRRLPTRTSCQAASRLPWQGPTRLHVSTVPLNTKKSYGNLQGEAYIRWFARFAPLLREMVTEDGSIVIEVGNAWLPGEPVMSTHVLEAFLRFLKKGDLHLCQEFIWYNPARLPSPVEWVNKERVRVKDAFTRIWWMSPTTRPKADNRKVLREYSPSMKRLIETGKYNAGLRPSQHDIGTDSFKADNGGAIPSNVGGAAALPSLDCAITPKRFAEFLSETANLLKSANTVSSDGYRKFCVAHGVPVHPARMPRTLVEFFLRFLTDEGDAVLDPFAGSNTTGAVAESLARRWISVEADWTYASHSIGRFDPSSLTETCKEINVAEVPPNLDGARFHPTADSSSSDAAPLVTS